MTEHMPSGPTKTAEAAVPRKKTRSILPIVIGIAVLIAILGAGVGVSYAIFVKRSGNPAIRAISNMFPISVAKVGKRSVLYRDYLKNMDAILKFKGSDAAKKLEEEQEMSLPSGVELEKGIYEKLIRQAALEELAETKGVSVTETELRAFFADIITAASSTTPDIGVYLLENYGWNEEDFRQNVLRSAILEQRLSVTLANEKQGDEAALTDYLDSRLKDKDVIRHLRF
jgi:hypothetical protein